MASFFPSSIAGTNFTGQAPGGGNGGGGGLSDFQKTALGGGLGAIFSLFAPQGSADKTLSTALPALSNQAKTLQSQGSGLLAQGGQDLAPVLKYYTQLASGDPTAELQATAPDRRRVIDQYDTARRSMAAAPRGGGQTSAITGSYANEASDLAVQQQQARTGAIDKLGSLSTTLQSLGLNAESIAGTELGNVIQAYLQQSKDQAQSASGLGASIGKIIGMGLAFL